MSYEESKVRLAMKRDAVRTAPEYDPDRLNREYESRLHKHYGKPGYWDLPPESWKIFPPGPPP